MSPGLRYQEIAWRGHGEWLVEMGRGTALLLIPPLFEEMNRCRAILVGMGLALADCGFAVHMPDLPGTGESERPLREIAWEEWQAFAEHLTAALKPAAILSVRGGALLEPSGLPRWRLSPVAGARIARELVRARKAAGDRASVEEIDDNARVEMTEFAGYRLAADLYAGLASATVPDAPGRTVRLRGEAATADRLLDCGPPWRRAEPRRDSMLSQQLANDVSNWMAECAG